MKARVHGVITKTDGQAYMDAFHATLRQTRNAVTLFDAVILDYRMPEKDALQVAKEMLALRPKQRIIFASAYVVETLTESVKHLGQIVELLQKPFEIDVLAEMVEYKGIYEELERINVKVKALKNFNVTHMQLVNLLTG